MRALGRPENRLIQRIWKNNWTSDAQGNFRIPLPFSEESYYLWGRVKVGNRWFGTNGQKIIEVDQQSPDRETLVIDAPLPRKKAGKGPDSKAAKGAPSSRPGAGGSSLRKGR